MANTYDFTVAAEGGMNAPWDRHLNVYIMKKTIDFGDEDIFTAALASDDTYQLFDIPAGTWVLGCWIDVTEAEATNTTATLAIGDTSSTAGYLTATAVATAGTYGGLYNGSEAYRALAGRFYGSAQADGDTAAERVISAKAGTAALSNAVVDFYCMCVTMT
jgi:hypothetical protein